MSRLSPKTKRRSQRGFAGSTRGRTRRPRLLWNPYGSLIEILEDRRLLSTLDITSGALTYDATDLASDLTVSIAPGGALTITDADQTITLTTGAMDAGWLGSGTNTVFGDFTSISSMTIGGTDAGQSLTLDYTNSDLNPVPSSGLIYDPAPATGGAVNSLTLQNGTFSSETYDATGAGAGTITYSDSFQSNVPITFSNLSPVTDTVSSPTFIFNAPAGSTTVNIVNGPLVGVTQTDEINDGGTGSFELVDFGNKTGVTANVNNAGATSTIDVTTAAAGLSTLNLNSGAGTETVDVEATPTGVTTTTDTGSVSGSTTNVGNAGLLSGIVGDLYVKSTGGTNTLAVNDSAAGAAETYSILGSQIVASSLPSFINFSGGGFSTLNMTTSPGSTVNLTGPVQSGVSTYNLNGGTTLNPDILNVTSNLSTLNYATAGSLGFGTGNPTINYTQFATINVTKPATAPAGTPVTFNATEGQALNNVVVATFTDPDLANTTANFTTSIDWGDGTPVSSGTVTATGSGTYDILGSHTYAAAGTYTVNVTLTDQGSTGSTVVGGTTINVTSTGPVSSTPNPIVSTANTAAAPLKAQGATVSGTPGAPLTGVLVATFMDTGVPGTPSDYTASIDWGNGTTSAATSITSQGTPNGVVFSVFGTNTYATAGTYPLTVTITKTASGATAIASGQAVISAAAVGTITPGTATALSVNTGVPLAAASVIGTFTSSNTSEPASDFSAVIDWGDGSPTSIGTVVAGTPAGTFNVEGTHTYAKNGTYTPTILLTQSGGSTLTLTSPATATITVTDLAVTGSTKNFTAVEGINTGPFVLATFTDPNTLATVADVTASLPVGGWGDGTPTSATGPGSLVVQEIGVTPSTSPTNPGAPIFEVLGSHTYTTATAAGTPDALSVVITTLGGATTTLTSPAGGGVTVADAPITASGTSITGIEGTSTGGVVIATFTDANPGATVADYTSGGGSVVVNWGDGTAPQTLPASALTSAGSPNGVLFTVTTSHTYAEEGFYQLRVTITDDGGSTASANGSATIADAPLTAVTPPPTVDATEAVLFSGEVGSFDDTNPKAPITDYRVAIDWGDGSPETVGMLSQPGGVGTAFLVDGTHTYAYSLPLGSPGSGIPGPQNGTYPITIYVNDVGGSELTVTNTAHVADVALTVTGNLNPASDSGVSNSDDITNVVQPNFLGTTNQPNATVTLYATASGSSTPFAIGMGVSNANDAWSITSDQALANGSYVISAIAVDSAGQTISNTTTIVSDLVIDTVGPKVTDVVFNRLQGNITVTFQDYGGPGNAGVGLNLSTVSDAANYQLVSVHHPRVGKYRVNVISASPGTTSGGQTATLTFNKGHYIRGGWYFFTVRSLSTSDLSGVQDIAGNALDGEYYGYFPSGNNVPGGNFVAQLTAIHHVTYAPSSVVGRATPVSPPGSRPTPSKTYSPITFNPSKLPRDSVRATARRLVKQVGARPVVHTVAAHVPKVERTSGGLLAGNTTNSAATSYVLMGAIDTHDAALDQVGGKKTHRS